MRNNANGTYLKQRHCWHVDSWPVKEQTAINRCLTCYTDRKYTGARVDNDTRYIDI
jgi:hypothetical protein